MAAAARVLLLATALAAPAAAQDVLIPRDGAMRSGRLTSCVGEVCVFGGAKVPRPEIAWLGLGRTAAKPPAATQTAVDEVHLAARGVIVSRVIGISLGVVATEARSLDRPQVAWIRFAGGAAGAAPSDLILRRAGGIERGELLGCAAGRCTMGGKSLTRAEIAWIGLQVTADAPPPLGDATRDEIHLDDGGIHPGPLVGIGAQNVVTQRDTYSRAAVAWVYLALLADENPPGAFGAPDDDDAESEEEKTGDEETRQDDDPEPPEPPTEQPPPPEDEPPPTLPPPPPGSGERGALWTGTVVGRCRGTWEGWLTEWRYRVQVRMREYRHSSPCIGASAGKRTWTYIDLEPEGSMVHNRLSMRTEEISCLGDGSVDVSTEPGAAGVGHGGGIWLNPMGCDELESFAGAGVPRGRGLYAEFVPTPHGAEFFTTCRGPDGTDTIDHGFISPTFGGGALAGQAECGDPQIRYLESDNGMMRGSYMTSCTNTCKMYVAFSVCREGVKCPPPQALPDEGPERDPCDPGDQSSLRDNCYQQLEQLRSQLEPHIAEYHRLQQEAQKFAKAFERADLECKIWDAVDTLLKAYVGGGAGKMGDAGKALLYLADVLDKVQKGELHTLLYPDEAKQFVKYYKQVNDLYASVTDDQLTKMKKRLKSCSGKVGLETEIAAEKFLGLLEAAKKGWETNVSPKLNDVRTKGLECAGWDHEAWKACMDYAECQGVPPDCGSEPSLDIE